MSKKFNERKMRSRSAGRPSDASATLSFSKLSNKKKSSGGSLRDRLLELLKEYQGELFKTNELSKMLAIRSDSDEYQLLRDELRQLEGEQVINRGSRRRYGMIPPPPRSVTGVLKIQHTGNGVVHPDKECGLTDTILIRMRNLSNALHDDRVSISLYATKPGERPQGEVINVLQRASQFVTGTVDAAKEQVYVRPESGKLRRDVIVPKRDLAGAKPGDKVRVELRDWENEYRDPEGKVIEVFGKRGGFQVEMKALAAEYGLTKDFPQDVLVEANAYSENISKDEIAKRLDLRKKIIFTIDPVDAKDFDDAISLTDTNTDGVVELGVHIADVSHYVTEGSALDNEALARGTSVYLAGGVVPMLPEELSNNICSLKPDVERLTYSVIMLVEEETGKVLKSEFHKSVIKSVMRFSYEEAEERIVSGKGKYAKLLKRMRKLSRTMYELRKAEGSIDFETDEVRFTFDAQGNPEAAYKKERLGSMRMIEDFMLAANRTVAEAIHTIGDQSRSVKPFLYRIHAEPDQSKLDDLSKLAKALGYHFSPEGATPKTVQKFLASLRNKPEEKMLNGLMLRAMSKAVYAEHNVGHFGLAFIHYTHFTSPIRRYPDLIVHRMLNEYHSHGGMLTKREHFYFNILPDIADQTSALERHAVEAERDSIKLAQLFVMRDKVGEEYPAVITGVQHYGLFVELDNGAEGLLHIRELPGYYIYDEVKMMLIPERSSYQRGSRPGRSSKTSRRIYRIGDSVIVKLIRANEVKRALDFGLGQEE